MKKWPILLFTITLTLILAGCNAATPAESTAPEPTAGSEPAVESEPTSTAVVESAIEEPDESEPTETVVNESEQAITNAVDQTAAEVEAETIVTEPKPEFDPDASPLVLALIPQENPEKLLGDIETISEYLQAELGFPVQGFVSQDHAAAVEALRHGEADISFMGALPYVLAHDQVGAQVILGEVYRGSSIYHGRIFVRKDSGIETVADLRGKSIAFADPISESGYLYPLEIFAEAGLLERGHDPQEFFSAVYFAGGYQQAIQAVANGYADAAGASQFADLLLTPEQLEEVVWIAESDAIPSHAVIARADLEPERIEAFKQAMLKLNQPEYQYLLSHVYSPDGYIEVTHDDYTSVEEIARLYGFIE
ncbi:MAG TPA: phosphate/phosphite/phosphonate ABC transporter substrate-binding protein [Anaerolineae bacterium]